MTVRFTLVNLVRCAPETLFDLSLDVDLHLRSMAAWRERVVESPTSPLGLDDVVTWKARHFGLPFTMTSRIAELQRPQRFVDEQVRGPFASFRHEHLFDPVEDVHDLEQAASLTGRQIGLGDVPVDHRA